MSIWPTKKLGDKNYFEILGSKIDKFDGKKEYLSTSSIDKNKIVAIEKVITYQKRPSRANMQPRLNSVWFAKMRNTVKVYSFTENNKDEVDRYILSTGFCGILCNSQKACPKYLEKIFLSKWFNDLKDSLASDKAIQKSLNNEDVAILQIPLPPLPEQKKIVYALDSIQSVVRVQEEIIEMTNELKRAMMKKLFTEGMQGEKLTETEIGKMPKSWKMKELREVVKESMLVNPKQQPNKQIKYIDVSSISSKFLKIVNFKEYSGKDAPSRARKEIKANDIIFATVRPSLRRLALVPIELDGEICSTAFCVIRADNKKIDSIFLFNYVGSNDFINQVTNLQAGANYPAVSDKQIFRQKIPVASLKEQREIANILQTIDQKIEIEQKKKALYEELFKTMLNKLMNKEIRTDNLRI